MSYAQVLLDLTRLRICDVPRRYGSMALARHSSLLARRVQGVLGMPKSLSSFKRMSIMKKSAFATLVCSVSLGMGALQWTGAPAHAAASSAAASPQPASAQETWHDLLQTGLPEASSSNEMLFVFNLSAVLKPVQPRMTENLMGVLAKLGSDADLHVRLVAMGERDAQGQLTSHVFPEVLAGPLTEAMETRCRDWIRALPWAGAGMAVEDQTTALTVILNTWAAHTLPEEGSRRLIYLTSEVTEPSDLSDPSFDMLRDYLSQHDLGSDNVEIYEFQTAQAHNETESPWQAATREEAQVSHFFISRSRYMKASPKNPQAE